MFSSRVGSLEENALAHALAAARARGPVRDLTESNPTVVGLDYPQAAFLEWLADPRALVYQPEPRGLPDARAAVAAYYVRHGLTLDPARVTLTASTSEAYAWLFKLLCEPGQRVLVPSPSYPLFAHLAALEGVHVVPYPLRYHGGWFFDLDELRPLVDDDVRAICVINPHNPTGMFLKKDERDQLVALCAGRHVALISDEVFADYTFVPDPTRVTTLAGTSQALTFCLSGLSKPCGLPQVKLGWIVSSGPPALVAEAEARLELIADTYLSVATPVQHAAPRLLSLVDDVGKQVLARVRRNRAHLRGALDQAPAALLDAEGGWSAVLRVPDTLTEEQWALALLDDGVLVHPGYFFDFDDGVHLIVSLLPHPSEFDGGVARLLARLLR